MDKRIRQVRFTNPLPDENPEAIYDVIEDRSERLLVSPVTQRDWPIRPHFTVKTSDTVEVKESK